MRLIRATFFVLFVIIICLSSFSLAFGQTKTATAKQSPKSQRRVTLSYNLEIRNIPQDARSITAWVPLPPNTQDQTLTDLTLERYIPYTLVSDNKENNEFLELNLDSALITADKKIDVTIKMKMERKASNVISNPLSKSDDTNPRTLIKYLWPDNLVPVKGAIADESHSITTGLTAPVDRARAIYDHIVKTVQFDKTVSGGGRGDANIALQKKAGDCIDINSLFIGESRAASLPTRFMMGLLLPIGKTEGEIDGFYSWAEFYLKNEGWIPVDITAAIKHPTKKNFYFGNLDVDRILISIGRDIRIPDSHLEPANFIFSPYIEIDGKPYQDISWKLNFAE